MKTKASLFILVLLLTACHFPSPTPPPTDLTVTPPPEASPTSANVPGLIIRGHVTFNGAGLANVKIYKRFSAYPHDLIATTDENGYYESDFIPIPGDEMVSVEAELAGYTFDPPYYYWRHYHGHEETTCDFAAVSTP